MTFSSPVSFAARASSTAARIACPHSGAGIRPSTLANCTAASNTLPCGYATASIRPSRTSAETSGESPW